MRFPASYLSGNASEWSRLYRGKSVWWMASLLLGEEEASPAGPSPSQKPINFQEIKTEEATFMLALKRWDSN